MDAKQLLRSVKKIDLQIRNKIIERDQWRDLALTITVAMDGDRVQSSGRKSKLADAVDKCIDMEAEIDNAVDALVKQKRRVVSLIESVESPVEYNVLHLVHIQYKKLQNVADLYEKDYGWATTTYGRALKSVQRIIDQEE